jgi:hypothetical protein
MSIWLVWAPQIPLSCGVEGRNIKGNYLTALGRAPSLLSQDLFEIKPKILLPGERRRRGEGGRRKLNLKSQI